MADDEETAEGEEEGKEKGSGKKLLIFGLIGGLAIGGGATFAALMFLGGGDQQAGEEEAVVEEEPLPELTQEYVKLNRIPAALSGPSGRQLGYIFFDFSLEVKDAADRDWILVRRPILRDAFLRAISRNGVTYPDRPTEVDYKTLTARLTKVANAALGREIVTDVLVVNSMQTMN